MQSKRTIRRCQACGNPFPFVPWMAKAGGGKFCSRPCYWASLPGRTRPLADRFWAHVDMNGPVPPHRPDLGPCWLWTAARDANGYGRLMIRQEDGRYRPSLAHRVSLFLQSGRWPADGGLHACDNPPCVRPYHLFEGDQVANMADCSAKGRTTQGERSASAKLTEALAIEIRARYATGTISQARLAAEYGIRQMTVSDLVRRVTWRHLPA